MEGLIFGGACVRREICGLHKPLGGAGGGGLIFGGVIKRGVFCITSLGGLIFGGAYFRNFTAFNYKLYVP